MKTENRRHSLVLHSAMVLGLTGDLLFRHTGAGLNVLVWVLALLGGWMVTRSSREPLSSQQRPLLGLVLGFAAIFAWREAGLLRLAGVIGLVTCATLLPLASGSESLVLVRVRDFFRALSGLIHRLLVGFIPAMLEARGHEAERGSSGLLLSAGRGVALAVPTLAIFGSLLASADAGFQRFAERLFNFNAESLIEHGFAIGGFAWLAAALVTPSAADTGATRAAGRPGRLGVIESVVVLGLLDLTFLVFVLLQGRYFFGGAVLVQATDGLTYATYARRGFFELVTVTALVLPLLLLFRGQLRADSASALKIYRALAGALTALTLVIVGSALHRMTIYQQEFGLTELRFYASAFIAGLAFTLLWFAATVLRERPGRFLSGGLLSWTAWVAMLVLANPAAVIAQVNIQRAVEGRDFDVLYAVSLGADAVPALVAGLDRLPPGYRRSLEAELRGHWSARGGRDWRAWTLAEWRARNVAGLSAAASTTPIP